MITRKQIEWSDEHCLDKCSKCGGTPFTLQMSLYTTACSNENCTEYVQGDNYVDVMVQWNKIQRK